MAKIGTHDGTFHCDEALAVFLLRLLPQYKDATLIRTRNPQLLNECDVVVDVGAVYDPSKHRYDHHQRGFQETLSDKHVMKLSSAGLIYKHFGKQVIQILSSGCLSDSDSEIIYQKVYTSFVEALDGIDNGISQYPQDSVRAYSINTDLSARVSYLNPRWNEDDKNIDERFLKASQLAGSEFVTVVESLVKSWLPARSIVKEAYDARFSTNASGKIMKLTQFAPWKEHLFEIEEEANGSSNNSSGGGGDNQVLFVLYEDTSKSWRIQCVAVGDSFQSRLPLPEPWRGVRDDNLSKLSNIEGCIFVHASGFIGGAKTYEAVFEMALRTLEFDREEKAKVNYCPDLVCSNLSPCPLHSFHQVSDSDLQGVIFDCDGTLADTMPTHFQAWTQVLSQYDIAFPEPQFYSLGGVPSLPIVHILLRQQPHIQLPTGVTPEEVVRRKQAAFEELDEHHTLKGIPHVLAIADNYRKAGLPMAVASGGDKVNVLKALRLLGIQDWFSVVVAAEDVKNGKPHPEPYLLAATRLGVDPTRVRAYEDTDIGLQSIRAAGMQALDIRVLPH